ncbi:MAG TPA: hypothetical protein DDW30_08200 [Clostridiales bacterium]|nr:hypothetical protein [Clostridiales bacterium]
MKQLRLIALLLALVTAFAAFSTVTFAEEPEGGRTVVEYDFSTMDSLDAVQIENPHAGGTGQALEACELSDGRLKLEAQIDKHCFVQLLDYYPAIKSYSDYTVTMRFSFDTTDSEATNVVNQRAGIVYNLTPHESTYSWAVIKADGVYENSRYSDGNWKADGSYQKNDKLDGGYSKDKEYTLTAHMKADGTIDMCYYDAEGNVIGDAAKGIKNYRSAQGIGIYLRACTMYVSYFSIVENGGFNPNIEKKGTETTALNFGTVADLSDLTGLSVVNGNVDNVTLTDGKLTVAADSTYHVLNLLDVASVGVEGKAWSIVMKASFSVATEMISGESKKMFGIAFDVDAENKNYSTAVIRAKGDHDMNSFANNAWKSGTRNWDVSNVNYYPNHEYEIAVIGYADGTVRMAIDGVLATDVMERTALTGSIGVICRNGTVSVSEIRVYEEAANEIAYIGTQSSGALEDGTYSVRFVAKLASAKASAAGFTVRVRVGETDKTKAFAVSNLYREVSGEAHGISLSYAANDFAGNYLLAQGIYGIPSDAGNVTFTVTPYYIQNGETVTAQSYEVVYNAGSLVSQTAVSE